MSKKDKKEKKEKKSKKGHKKQVKLEMKQQSEQLILEEIDGAMQESVPEKASDVSEPVNVLDKTCFLSQKGPKPVGPYSTACVSGGLVFLSGVIGLIPETGQLAEGGLEGQAKQVFENIGIILSEMNLDFRHVVKTSVFLTDISKFADVNQIYAQYFTENFPARSAVQVAALPLGAEVEVELIAAVPETGILCE